MYADSDFIADCEINPQEYEGTLDIEVQNRDTETVQNRILGSYQYTVNKKTGTITFQVSPEEGLGIKGFRLINEFGTAIYSEEPVPVNDSLTYLSILCGDFTTIRVELYGEDNTLLYTGTLDTKTKEIYE